MLILSLAYPTAALMTFLTRPEHQDLLLLIYYLKRLASDRKFFSLGIPSGMTRRTSFSSTSKGEEPHSLIDSETGLQSYSRKHWPLSLLLLSFLVTEIKLSVKRVQLVLVLASQSKQILVEKRTVWLTSEDARIRTFYSGNSTSSAYWYSGLTRCRRP